MASAETLIKKFNNIKTLPHIAIRLSKMISDDKSTMEEFEQVIRMDPTLVLRILKLVNSPYYALQQKVKSVSEAVVFIGMENLRNMVVVEALKDIFKQKKDGAAFSRSKLWLHSAAVGICSQMIYERIFEKKSEDAFLCGILHDVGMIVEDQVVPDQFESACKAYQPGEQPITKLESEHIGTHHCSVGALLALDWKFPKDVQEGIKMHHRDMNAVDPESIPGTIQIAEYLVSRLEYAALQGMKGLLSKPLMAHIKMNIEEYRSLSRDLPNEMAKAKEIYQMDEESN